jgi:hypothetical protein
MQLPPQPVPQELDPLGVLPRDDFRNLARQDVVDRAAVPADREGVADALRGIAVAEPHRHQLEVAHDPVRAVGQHGRQRDAVEARLDRCDGAHPAIILVSRRGAARNARIAPATG